MPPAETVVKLLLCGALIVSTFALSLPDDPSAFAALSCGPHDRTSDPAWREATCERAMPLQQAPGAYTLKARIDDLELAGRSFEHGVSFSAGPAQGLPAPTTTPVSQRSANGPVRIYLPVIFK